ncbi:MAG: response regulator transcription factor [Planctomycetota bacterium]|nr:response regulator transcription factor [Planctomycetota bacterium]
MRLLVVEDEVDLLESLAQALREDGYAVDTADNGDDGYFKAKTWDYDAIVLDWMLPKLNGIELLRRLRRDKKTPVLLLTAKDAVSDRVAGLDQGADDFLVKPFNLSELLARVRALIRRSTGNASNLILIGSIEINLASKTVMESGNAIELTAREYAMLELLAVHAGKLVSRTMIYNHIFDEQDDTLSNLVDVHISHLRKKLGRDLIETRRGQGYILNV